MTKQILQQINMENNIISITEDLDSIYDLIDELESNNIIETLSGLKTIYNYKNDRENMYK